MATLRNEVTRRYDAMLERRDGEIIALITRCTTTTPVDGRGKQYSKGTEQTDAWTFPVEDLGKLMSALVEGAVYAATDEPIPDGERNVSIWVVDRRLLPLAGVDRGGELDTRFWSVAEAIAWVQTERAEDMSHVYVVSRSPENGETFDDIVRDGRIIWSSAK